MAEFGSAGASVSQEELFGLWMNRGRAMERRAKAVTMGVAAALSAMTGGSAFRWLLESAEDE